MEEFKKMLFGVYALFHLVVLDVTLTSSEEKHRKTHTSTVGNRTASWNVNKKWTREG